MSTVHKPEAVGDIIVEIYRNCALTRTRLIARVVTNIFDEELKPYGINSPQFALLVMIFKRGPANRSEIGRFSHQDRSTLSRNLRLIDAEGWVTEIKSPAIGRSRPLMLTGVGQTLLKEAAPAWRIAQRKALAVLGEEGIEAVTKMGDSILG